MSAANNQARRLVLLLSLVLMAAGCGESDTVDRPFIRGWQLDEEQCAQPVVGSRCYRLTLDVFDHEGESEASCRIYALDDDGTAYDLDEIAPDLDLQSAEHEVAIIDGFTVRSGDVPVFDVVLPVVEEESFRRWQVNCHPGAPG